MEGMGPKVKDWDEEDDDMDFEQSTQPGLEEMQCVNAIVEASQVRTRKNSAVVKKRKQKEKADHDDTISASPTSPPANVVDDVEETPIMDDRLFDGYKSEELELLAGDSDKENDKFPMYNAEDNRTEEITVGMEFENLDVSR
ncbi:hypothetical protein CRG98_006829 [Punica granatum]|uniref:Uncharacterized protein n=1 Tax=Punica granatum TaxID=22663 RepID=A0A2I0KWA2_PUNGR|nr:hypothetical protein CRG98_006829 [Punica granatum]